MGVVVSVANQKGGVGKTNTALTLAHLLHLQGRDVCVLDLDAPGETDAGSGRAAGSAAALRRAKLIGIPAYTALTFPERRLPQYVIIDCPPDVGDQRADYAVKNSDLVIVPSGLSLDDLEVSQAYAELLSAPTRILLTRVNPLSGRAARLTRQALERGGLKVFENYVRHYNVYLDASAYGSVAGIPTREGRRATRDYARVLEEIYG